MTPAKASCLLALVASCLVTMADEVRFEKLDLTESASGHCLAPVTVDGHDARFIVDSGAGTVIIVGKTYAESIGKDLAGRFTERGEIPKRGAPRVPRSRRVHGGLRLKRADARRARRFAGADRDLLTVRREEPLRQ